MPFEDKPTATTGRCQIVDRLSECFRELAATDLVVKTAIRMDPGESLLPDEMEAWTKYNDQIALASHQMHRLWCDAIHRHQDALRKADTPGMENEQG